MSSGIYPRTKKHIENWKKSRVGFKHTEETKKKMSIIHKNDPNNKYWLGKVGEKSAHWKGGFKNKLPKCIECEKLLSNISNKYCRKHFGIGAKGEKSWRWIKDRTKLKTGREKAYDTKYKYWMKLVKDRDKWKCRISDRNCEGRLEAHHILIWRDFPELRYEINNGITLCHAHHPRKRAEEKRLAPLFQELVSVSKE